jgi:hypothetical protein
VTVVTADQLNAALAQQWCNGCGLPRAKWGPVCGGMTQGDGTHYHSPEWWRQRFLADVRVQTAVNEREQLLIQAVTDRLTRLADPLIEEGWHPELIVFTADEIERIPGYKVALVVPLADSNGCKRQ